jgi:putative NADH-flavin reductase
MAFDVSAWVRQPSTITGLASAAATIVGGAVYHFTASPAQSLASVGIVFSAFHVAINDNSALPSDVEKLAIDAATAAASKKLAAAIPALFADAGAVMKDVAAPGA